MKNIPTWLEHNWFKIVAAIMLFWAVGDHPYVYFQILRWAVAVAAMYTAIQYFQEKIIPLGLLFVAVGILFNPFTPFYMDRETWFWIDITVGILFLVFAFKNHRNNSIKQEHV